MPTTNKLRRFIMANYIALSSVVVDKNDILYKTLGHLQDFKLDMMQVSVIFHKAGRTEVATAISSLVQSLNTNASLIMHGEREAMQRIADDLDLQAPVEF
jgi:hypothetical protein